MRPSAGIGRTVFGLLGDPVSHSISPAVHRAAFRELGVDAEYVARRVDAAELEGALRELAARGGGNVTLPHKERAAGIVEARTPAVESTGACNCFWQDDAGRLWGDNTDVDGFRAAIRELDLTLDGSRVLLLGAGGAARAVAAACVMDGVKRLDLLNRTLVRAERLAEELAGTPPARLRVLARAGDLGAGYDLVVNATSLGLRPSDPLPIDLEPLEAAAAFDLTYAPGGTRWTDHAARLGVRVADGVTMLVHQAARSLIRWLGDVEPPLPQMRLAARVALDDAAMRG